MLRSFVLLLSFATATGFLTSPRATLPTRSRACATPRAERQGVFATPRVTRDTGGARMTLEQAADATPLPQAVSSPDRLVEQMGLLWDLEVARVQEEPKQSAEVQARYPALEITQGQILRQSPTDATRFWWHLYRS